MATDITKFNVTSSAQLVVAAARRRSFILQNQSDTDIYISLGNASVTGPSGSYPGIKVLANGGVWSGTAVSPWDQSNDDAIYAIHASTGNKVLVVHENKM